MNSVYYTYRVQIANPERVQVEKWGLERDPLGEPSGAFGYKGLLRQQIDVLIKAARDDELKDSEQVKELGEALFQALFDDALCHDFVAFYNQVIHTEDKLLRVELDVDEQELPEVAALPWEFMRLPTSANLGTLWLGTAPNLIFSRRRAHWFVPKRIQLEPDERLKIALAVATPSDLKPVAYEEMWLALQEWAQKQADRVELMPLVNPATPKTLDEALAHKPHIFHFIGHGRLLEEGNRQPGQLALVDDLGEARWVEADYFSDLFSRHRPGVVFLQACEGGKLSASQALVGMGSRVVQQNIPVVVAMQYPVSNSTASRFARRFYQRLAEGDPVDRAAQDGRRHIALGPKRYGARDFVTPVLFMRVPEGHLFQRSKAEDFSLFATNVELYDKVLYDRKKKLENAKRILEGPVFGVWVQGDRGSGRTPLAIEIAHQCIRHKRLFSHCKYFSARSEGKSRDSAEFVEFAYQAKLERPEGKILIIVDDWECFRPSERKQLLDRLKNFLHDTGCKAIVVSALEPEHSRGWRRISSGDYLEKDEISQFVDEYVLDGRPRVGRVLDFIGRSRWLADVYAATGGRVDRLWRFLEQIAWAEHGGAPGWQARCYKEALKNTDDPLEAKKFVTQRVERLHPKHTRIIKALSLFKGSASLDMLIQITGSPLNDLDPLLDELVVMHLVNKLPGQETPRYQLAFPKREAIMQELGTDPDLIQRFFEVWLGYAKEYGGERYHGYPELADEHENLEGVLQRMWDVANVQVHPEPDAARIEKGAPLPSDAFVSLESQPEKQKRAASYYIALREHLTHYFRCEGWWSDYRLSARRAYAAACALQQKPDVVAWQAYQAAEVYSHEGSHTYADLLIAESWIDQVEEAIEEGGLVIAWPGLVSRMRGVIAMRKHKYQKSRDCFQKALKHFEKMQIPEQIPGIRFYLAKLEMRYNPDYEGGQSYKRALEHLEKAISIARGSDMKEEEAVIRVQKAELLLWWGRWTEAADELDKVLQSTKKPDRKDLLAGSYLWDAVIHQNQSANEENQDQSKHWLDKAIDQAEKALTIQKDATVSARSFGQNKKALEIQEDVMDRSLYLCRIYAVLAALHYARWKVVGDVEDEKQFRDHLNNLDELLKARQHFGPRKQHDPEADYEAACLKVMEEDLDGALDTLKSVVKIQPGCILRAENDFRLAVLTQGAYRAKWKAVKAGLKKGEGGG